MLGEQKHNNYLSEAESRLRQLSPERLRVAVAFLAYLQETTENHVKEELMSIPGFAASFHNTEKSQDKLEETASNQFAEDAEVWQAYLASEKKWEEVYRRLADS
ncbi:MAG: hypothetical protein KME32_00375 [Mojavia pulchra JT2-VF2]|jgi:regulator of sirC expression with transglutaminase-like and TPR domain|uniref:DUF2281 domain-containing protein n=1 Tax=Mojavia pulchra JT2-VF2 TaxID=287848 RepID=A0A951UDR1_9NOST|nr:hypothetical protein [Mojavia pulchra JT2-VF2]